MTVSACPHCGSAVRPGAEYCLDCGRPFHVGTRVDLLRERLSENSFWAVLALLVVAAVGALVAIAAARNGKSETSMLVATNLPARTTAPVIPVLGATGGTPPVVTTATTPAPTPPTEPTLTRWTLADGYTVVLSTVPRKTGRATALQIAKRALTQGMRSVGLINTGEYSSLPADSYLVFSGVYRSSGEAAAHVSDAKRAGFASAYPLRITR